MSSADARAGESISLGGSAAQRTQPIENSVPVQLPSSFDPPRPGSPTKELVWLVFGGTGYIGQQVAEFIEAKGDILVNICCDSLYEDANQTIPQEPAADGTEKHYRCDVRSLKSVEQAFQSAIDKHGRVDIASFCCTYGVIGSCEDQDDFDTRGQFEANFMGNLNLIQTALPCFRRQGGGRFMIFTSNTVGSLGTPGLGPYAATRYAVEGMVESIVYELEPLNIKFIMVETELLGRDTQRRPDDPSVPWSRFVLREPSEAYAQDSAPALHAQRAFAWQGHHRLTSWERSAEAVWQLGHAGNPPLRMLLGNQAVESAKDRLRSATEEMDDWKHLNFPAPVEPGVSPSAQPAASSSSQQRMGDGDTRRASAATRDEISQDDEDEDGEGESGDHDEMTEAADRMRLI